MIRSIHSGWAARARSAVLLVTAGLALAACSGAGSTEAIKSTLQTIPETQREIDHAVRAPFQTGEPVKVTKGEGSLGPAASAIDEAQIKKAVERYAEARKQKSGSYIAAGVKLTPDGKQRVLVLFTSQDWCQPQGCDMAILEPYSFGWRTVGSISRVRAPVLVSPKVTNGWYDLWATTGREAPDTKKGDGKSFVQSVRLPYGANGYPGTTTFATTSGDAPAKPEGVVVFLTAKLDIPDKVRFATAGRDAAAKKKKSSLLDAAQAKTTDKPVEAPAAK